MFLRCVYSVGYVLCKIFFKSSSYILGGFVSTIILQCNIIILQCKIKMCPEMIITLS